MYLHKNIENGGFQKWTGYPDTPVLTSDYPKQLIMNPYGTPILFVTTGSCYGVAGQNLYTTSTSKFYTWNGTAWQFASNFTGNSGISITTDAMQQANADTYTNSSLTTVYFAKTTTLEQDAGIVSNLQRIR